MDLEKALAGCEIDKNLCKKVWDVWKTFPISSDDVEETKELRLAGTMDKFEIPKSDEDKIREMFEKWDEEENKERMQRMARWASRMES